MKKLLIVLTVLGMTGSVVARSSASHTIRIRIIRPNTFNIQSLAQSDTATSLKITGNQASDFSLNWRTSDQNKRITVSTADTMESAKLIMNGETEIELSQAHLDVTNGLASQKGTFHVRLVQGGHVLKPARLVYTLTDS